MRRANHNCVLLALLAAVFAVVLCAAPTQAQAESKTVTLHAEGGSGCPETIDLNADGTLPTLPSPTKDNYTFDGWCTDKVTYVAWGNFYEAWNQRTPAPVAKHPDGHSYTYDNDYWTWLAKSDGKIVGSGESLPAGVSDLYACYDANSVTVIFNWNGWNGQYTSMSATRDYNMPTGAAPLEVWSGHTFEGWYTKPEKGQGERFSVTDGVTKSQTVYAHYSGMADNPVADREQQTASRIEAFDISLSPREASIDPNGGSITITANLSMKNSIIRPTTQNWDNVTWTVTEGKDLISLTGSGPNRTVKANGKTGTVTITASFVNDKGKTVTSIPSKITLEAHVHTYSKEQILVAPTCERWGIGKKTCTSCGDVQQIEHEPIAHTYKTVTKAATCTEDGSEKTICTMCNHVGSTKVLPKTGHNFEEKTLKQTCVGTAVQKTCKNCGFIETYESGVTGKEHSWSKEWTVDKPATCGAAGSKSHHCTECGMTTESTEIPATGNHVFGGWHTTKVATHEVNGEREHTCTICGKVETEELPVLVSDSPVTTPDEPQQEPGSATEDPGAEANEQQLFRLYNAQTGDHIYTSDAAKRDELVASNGYQTETVQGTTALPKKSNTPVYQLDNQWTGEHHYTIDRNEYDTLVKAGWTGRDVAFYSADPASGVKVYRLFNPYAEAQGKGAAAHHYTADPAEVADLRSRGYELDTNAGWFYLPA